MLAIPACGLSQENIQATVDAKLSQAIAAIPTVTPQPTPTPFTLPTFIPTATPQPTATPVFFPTPLPTSTPFILPTAQPTPTPPLTIRVGTTLYWIRCSADSSAFDDLLETFNEIFASWEFIS